MAQIRSYLRFNGNAQEAFDFYKSCLGGDLTTTKIGESPMAQFMPDKKDRIFHAQLKSGDLVLLGSDMIPDDGLKKGNTSVLTLECQSKKEAQDLFAKLSEGGKVGHALSEQEWGTIGDFVDKFDVDWFVVCMEPKA
ncbi:MAG TPA: VOC family protein [Candidatus Saccharimonadales bacterium]|nr:VOC family protein [Candidatus Saccharimonadales bacterium]